MSVPTVNTTDQITFLTLECKFKIYNKQQEFRKAHSKKLRNSEYISELFYYCCYLFYGLICLLIFFLEEKVKVQKV